MLRCQTGVLAGILAAVLLMAGCQEQSREPAERVQTGKPVQTVDTARIGNPAVDRILADDRDADLFLMDGVVYMNAEPLDWVRAQTWHKGEMVMEVTKQTVNSEEFANGTATKLPVGTKIYAAVEPGDDYIAVVNGEEIRYLGLREG